MVQDIGDFILGTVGQDGNRHAAESSRCKECQGPVGHALRQDSNLVACFYAETGHTLGQLVAGVAETAVCVGLGSVDKLAGRPLYIFCG